MHVYATVRAMQDAARTAMREGRTLALVPTMGALHAGHIALVHEARRHANHVTVSIFVNPTQFGPNEDFDRYPRTWEQDLAALREAGVDAVFAPNVHDLYPFGQEERVWVQVEALDAHLCGPFRPGHFRGVTTVVSKLFLACQPDVAVFGLKDAQQFFILKRMTEALGFPIRMVGVPTVREADGLALSSRNRYLTPEQRAHAAAIPKALFHIRERIVKGEREVKPLVQSLHARIQEAPGARVQYAEVVDTQRLQPVDLLADGMQVLVAVAVYVGQTRLIDNLIIDVSAASTHAHHAVSRQVA